jgi:hypothetical protein
MKTAFYAILFVLMTMAFGFTQTITKADILATVKHMRVLAQEQKNELDKANYDYQQQSEELDKQILVANKYHKEASENARERDVILFLFAGIFSAYLGTLFAAPLSKLAEPYGMIAVIGAYTGSAILGYSLGRLILSSLAQFIP